LFLALLFLAAATFDESYRAGLLALQRGDLAAAQSNLEEARRLSPRDGRAWIALAQIYWRRHKLAEADDAAAKAAALSPDNSAVVQGLAIYYFEIAQPLLDRQQFAEALAALKKAPPTAQIELARGVAHYGLRRFDDAADAFLRTIALAPETPQPYDFLGRILDQVPNRLPQVTERFAAYHAAHPDLPAARLLYAKALNAQSLDPEKVLTLLDRPTDASAWFERALALDSLHRYSDAVAAYEHSAQLAPADPATHYHLARDYDRLGNHEAAQRERKTHADLIQNKL